MDKEKEEKIKELFPFIYEGGGYFRRKAPIGVKSEIIHGMEAIEFIYDSLTTGKAREYINKS